MTLKQIAGAPFTVVQYHEHVSIINAIGYAVARIAFGPPRSHMPDMYRALDTAHAWVERLNAPLVDHETTTDARMREALTNIAAVGHARDNAQRANDKLDTCIEWARAALGPVETRPCTCHPDDRPPFCQQKYAASECHRAFAEHQKSVT